MFRLMILSLAAACAVAGPAAGQRADDRLIVRNERIGAVALGGTLAEVVAAIGQPTTPPVFIGQHGIFTWTTGPAAGFRVDTWGPRNEVYEISIGRGGERYATAEGLRVGMSEVDLRIRLGNPQQRFWIESYRLWFLTYSGLQAGIDPEGRVAFLAICRPQYQRRPTARRFWCQPR